MYEYHKSKLKVQAQVIYDELLKNIGKLAKVGMVDLEMGYRTELLQDAADAYHALRLDRPEFYFLGHELKVELRSNGMLRIIQHIKYSQNHIMRINRLLRKSISEIVTPVKDMPVLKKEEMIYRAIGRKFVYKDGIYSHDLAGLLVYKAGVCESLAGFLTLALREAGIEAAVVHGYGKSEPHAWCKVWINGEKKYLDVTWDMERCKLGFPLSYFNLTYKQMAKDHKLVGNLRKASSS